MKMAVLLAAMLFAGSASTALAQGTGGGPPSPGTGGVPGGMSPGIGGTTPGPGGVSPGIGNSTPPAPGIDPTSNPPSALGGGPKSGGTANGPHTAPNIADTSDASVKAEYEERVPYIPCPADVRFPNGHQACLGLPEYSRRYQPWR
jgi:hypothetical protein